MSGFVLDCSISLAWAYPDESSTLADAVWRRLRHDTAIVPTLWRLEMTNGLVIGERRGRMSGVDVADFLRRLASLPITLDTTGPDRAFGSILELARVEGLSAYDAVYLDLAMRHRIGLATADRAMAAAAKRNSVPLIEA